MALPVEDAALTGADGGEQPFGGDAAGHQRGDHRTGADPHVEIEAPGGEAPGKEPVDSREGADFVGGAHNPSAGQDEGGLAALRGHGGR